MRISDWSSDVCSSDLKMFSQRCLLKGYRPIGPMRTQRGMPAGQIPAPLLPQLTDQILLFRPAAAVAQFQTPEFRQQARDAGQIGRAACRERVGQYWLISVVAV